MAQKPKIRFKLQKPKPLLIIVIAVMLILCTVTLITVHSAIQATRAETDALRSEAHAQETLQERLERYIQEMGTIQAILRIAQEELGMVPPDAVIFDTETGN